MSKDFRLNLPNILSLARIVLAIVFAVLLFYSFRYLAAGIFLLAVITNVLDGYLARKYNEITLLGKILDPAADRLLMILAFLVLFFKNEIPVGLAVFAVGYHLVIVIGWVIIFQTKKISIEHNFWGKLNSFLQALMFFAVIFNFHTTIFFGVVTLSLLVAFISYVREAVLALKR